MELKYWLILVGISTLLFILGYIAGRTDGVKRHVDKQVEDAKAILRYEKEKNGGRWLTKEEVKDKKDELIMMVIRDEVTFKIRYEDEDKDYLVCIMINKDSGEELAQFNYWK